MKILWYNSSKCVAFYTVQAHCRVERGLRRQSVLRETGLLLSFCSSFQWPGDLVFFPPGKRLNMLGCIWKLYTIGRFVKVQLDKVALPLDWSPVSSKPQSPDTSDVKPVPASILRDRRMMARRPENGAGMAQVGADGERPLL